MARCLELAEVHRGRTSPNPLVGCVIVDRRGRVIAEGAHRGPGTDHAEVAALKQLGGKAPGATLYVNLEPCNHHGRTPPCAPVVRDAGVARVVIGTADPIASHSGGLAVLRRARIAVRVGVLAERCQRANLAFFTWARSGRAAFTLKAAITLDGKIATVAGQSKWITGPAARDDVQRLRDRHDAVLVGIGTVLADDPRLTARLPGARDPVRVVIDSQLRTPLDARVLPRPGPGSAGSRTIIACGTGAPAVREARLVARGAEVWRVRRHRDGRLDLAQVARRLAAAGLLAVLVEGGGEIHASLLAHRLADQLTIYLAPKLVGGPAKSWVGGAGVAALAAAYPLVFDAPPILLGDDLRITAVMAATPGRAPRRRGRARST
ncbi:MAG TPA: bifunctional diaminohydroxyphosphoribosylaminopyrimidine deaminase/5-amino-6-(5-phosphoribosylamino)uracil reductase RibD [Kofleriaceae bacterium]|jgi:diaminohydroxyphosphoribosylaminopyrimidine deaminase/5-amino-6-(5-phosphoribosylamino)uracil reductase|nr:bifunctional diaminohydroxyphosphoribosylaminopyrimidine deaminase/5-amino-6-(5-phosphoribosylamino)uracil reductase RibD [Kofleriaceae bacterium]